MAGRGGRLDARRRRLRASGRGQLQPRALFAGVERADSVTVDLHKWLGVQKSCSAVLVRHRACWRRASVTRSHTCGATTTSCRTRSSARSSTRGRFARSRPGSPSASTGRARSGCGSSTRSRSPTRFAAMVREHPQLELLVEPTLSTVCFRHVPAGLGAADLDNHNERLAAAIQRDGQRLPRRRRRRRADLPAGLLRQLPHPGARSGSDHRDGRRPRPHAGRGRLTPGRPAGLSRRPARVGRPASASPSGSCRPGRSRARADLPAACR